MNVGEVMCSRVIEVSPSDSCATAAALMNAHNVGAIPVVERGEVRGMLTDRDIVLRCIALGMDARKVHAEDVMTHSAACVSPAHSVEDAAHLMAQKQVRRLPVVEDGRIQGMISIADLARMRRDVEIAETITEISKPD